jgi:hypothetical protein
MAVNDEPPRRRRVARLSLFGVALLGLALILLAVGARFALLRGPGDTVGRLPVDAGDNVSSASLILAAGAVVAGVFVGLAALHAAAAMRVLARDRRIPAALSPQMRWMRDIMLTPLGRSATRLVDEPELPAGKLAPGRAGSGHEAAAPDCAGPGA